MAKPWLGKVGALFHYMHSLPMDMKRGCIGILIHPHFFCKILYRASDMENMLQENCGEAYMSSK